MKFYQTNIGDVFQYLDVDLIGIKLSYSRNDQGDEIMVNAVVIKTGQLCRIDSDAKIKLKEIEIK